MDKEPQTKPEPAKSASSNATATTTTSTTTITTTTTTSTVTPSQQANGTPKSSPALTAVTTFHNQPPPTERKVVQVTVQIFNCPGTRTPADWNRPAEQVLQEMHVALQLQRKVQFSAHQRDGKDVVGLMVVMLALFSPGQSVWGQAGSGLLDHCVIFTTDSENGLSAQHARVTSSRQSGPELQPRRQDLSTNSAPRKEPLQPGPDAPESSDDVGEGLDYSVVDVGEGLDYSVVDVGEGLDYSVVDVGEGLH
ncbi:hypothetical protein NFI96_013730 [Prochilodus magdalenae]|nr:hypothetical protein NFI96_013730 [Prochilodus magdalenae]